jgi:hypothetical protein
MNMFTNMVRKEPGGLRLILAIAAAAAIVVGLTILIGLEMCYREGTRFVHVGGYLSLPIWFACVSVWGILGGGVGIVTGALGPPRWAFCLGMAAGAVPLVLLWVLSLSGPGGYSQPHPLGMPAYVLRVLLPALPGGVGAQIMAGGRCGPT